nr:MAG TPA: hypothetical protein [Caudoviricetes sp.]
MKNGGLKIDRRGEILPREGAGLRRTGLQL